jgi:hypothetical protein
MASNPQSVKPSLSTEPSKIVLHVHPNFIKRIPDPHETRRWCYAGTIPALEAIKLVRGNANPRLADLKGKVAGEIRGTVYNDPKEFHLRNRGIIVSTQDATFDTDTKTLTLENPKVENETVLWGILDGGHTWDVLRDVNVVAAGDDVDGSLAALKDTWVDIKIRIGLTKDEVVPAAAANNTSTQLRPWTLANFKGQLVPLQNMVKKALPELADEIAFKENQTNEATGNECYWDVLDLLQRMTLLNIGLYPGYEPDKQPVVAYAAKSRVLDLYVSNPKSYLAMANILPSIFQMVPIVESKLSQSAKVNGNLAFANRAKSGEVDPSFGSKKSFVRKYRINDAVIFPMVAALRPLLDEENGKVEWVTDPVAFLDENLEAMYQTFLRFYDDVPEKTNKNRLSGMGKDTSIWQTMHAKVLAILAKPVKRK